MPVPLLPVVAVAGAAAWLGMNEHGQAPGAVPAPEEQKPPVEERWPPAPPMPISTTTSPVAGDSAPSPDPATALIESGAGEAAGVVKEAVAGAASIAVGGVLAGEGVGASLAAGASSLGASAEAAAGATGAVAVPVAVIGTDVLLAAASLYTLFGGDLSNFFPTDAAGLTPAQHAQLDAALKAGTDPGVALAAVEGRTGTKQILDAEGNYVPVGGIGTGTLRGAAGARQAQLMAAAEAQTL